MHGFSDCNICRLLDLYFLRTALRPGGLRSGHGLFVHSGGVRCDGGHVPWSAAASAFPWSLLWRIGRFAGCCICRHVQQLFLPRRSWFVGCGLCLFLGSVRNGRNGLRAAARKRLLSVRFNVSDLSTQFLLLLQLRFNGHTQLCYCSRGRRNRFLSCFENDVANFDGRGARVPVLSKGW